MARGREQALAFRTRVVDRLERHRVGCLEQLVRIPDHAADPVDRVDDLLRAHAPIVVGVEQVERALVELEPLHRTAERDPQLLVEILDREQISAGVEARLVDAAGTKEAPAVRGGGGLGSHGVAELLETASAASVRRRCTGGTW
ncbi:MAG: hypothetical protein U1E76_00310 [Planctomycetota bacterium]